MYHIFFIHSSVDGHLGCFHALVTVNSAAMNIVLHASFQIMVFSREKGTLLHCWWECKLVQPLLIAVRSFLKKLKNRATI